MSGRDGTKFYTRISKTKLVFVCAIIALAVWLLFPLLNTGRPRPWFVNDLSNLHNIIIGFYEYALDHDGEFPAHASLVKDDDSIGDWEFVSRQDPKGFVKPVAENLEPEEWYEYGSYWFYPTKGLIIDSIPDPTTFVIAYCPPYKEGIDGKDHPALFLDGHTEMLSKDELFDLIVNQQQQLYAQLNE